MLRLLEGHQAAQVAEFGVVEIGLAEPALHADRDRPPFLGGAVRGGQCLGARGQLVEGGPLDPLARLDHDDGRLGAGGDRLRQRTEQVALAARAAGLRRRTHHHEVGLLGLTQDGVPDVRCLAQDRLTPTVEVLLDEGCQRPLRLGPDGQRDPRRHEVEDDDRRVVMTGDGVGVVERQLGMRAAAHRDQHPPDLPGAALLDDGDVARRVADDLVDRRREDGRRGAVPAGRGLAAPAEDDQVGLLLGGGLDDPFRGMPADPHDRVDRRSVWHVVEHPLEQPPGVARAGRALGQGHPLGHLHDAQGGQLAGALVEHGGAQPDQLLGGHRVGDRDEDPGRQRRSCRHDPASFQRLTRYGLSSSNSRAWRSTRSSAWSVVTWRFSMMKLATRPK